MNEKNESVPVTLREKILDYIGHDCQGRGIFGALLEAAYHKVQRILLPL
jgi:hypothetical protein